MQINQKLMSSCVGHEKVGLYIHIPYCSKKCYYCDFVSFENREETMVAYLCALNKEAQQYMGEEIDSIFIGGGTPSYLPKEQIEKLLGDMQKVFCITENVEITIEANPNSFTAQKAAEYKRAGINRLSFGLQAIQPHLLREIGRTHTYEDFLTAVKVAKEAGFTNISADILYSLPKQTIVEVEETAKAIGQLGLAHVSAYALKLEEEVPLYGVQQPDEETDRGMFHQIKETLEKYGFARYEISNFAKPGKESKHNLKYWRGEEYIGLGIGAHSFYQDIRYQNKNDLDVYLKESTGVREILEIHPNKTTEAVLLKTRLKEGLLLQEIPEIKKAEPLLLKLQEEKLITRTAQGFYLTDMGMDIQNAIVFAILDELER